MRVGEEIARKGGTLSDLYLIRKLVEDMDEELVADGMTVKGMLLTDADNFVRKINQVIPLIERELPEWAKEIARTTFNNRGGFVIWGPIKKEVCKNEKTVSVTPI